MRSFNKSSLLLSLCAAGVLASPSFAVTFVGYCKNGSVWKGTAPDCASARAFVNLKCGGAANVVKFFCPAVMMAGPGAGWVQASGDGIDEKPTTTAIVGVDLPPLGGGADTTLTLMGPVVVARTGPSDVLGTCTGGTNAGNRCTSNAGCPGSTCSISSGSQDGVNDILATEIVFMNLVGSGATLIAGADNGTNDVLSASLGVIDQVGLTAGADGFFDIFFEIQGGFGTGYNHAALRVSAAAGGITQVPCYNEVFSYSGPPIGVFTDPVGGSEIARIVSVSHDSGPPPPPPDPQGACCGPFGCVETSEADCEPPGKYRGDGTQCATQTNCEGIPAVSEWGLVALTVAMLAVGTIVLRRRMARA